jgi:acyl carrier protein
LYYAVDISDKEALQKIYPDIQQKSGAIEGIFHLARFVEDDLIMNKSWESFQNVLKAKVDGAFNLDEVFADEPLSFFSLFSSLASFGLAGSSDYAYATAFQNEFASYRNQMTKTAKRKGLTIAKCWGPWTVDTYQPANRDENLKSAGFDLMDMEAAFELMEKLSFENEVLGITAVSNKDLVKSRYGLTPQVVNPEVNNASNNGLGSKLERWEALHRKGIQVSQQEILDYIESYDIQNMDNTFIDRIHVLLEGPEKQVPVEETKAIVVQETKQEETFAGLEDITQTIRQHLCDVLKLNDIENEGAFQQYGLSSITGMQLAVRLEKAMKMPVKPQWLITYPSVQTLADYLFDQIQNNNN